jgi:replicative DNA helicase
MMRPSDFKSMTEAAGLMYDSPLWIVEPRPARMSDVAAALRLMRTEHSIRLAIVDHPGNIRLGHPTSRQHEQRAEISRVFKQLALELSIPLIVLVQLRGDVDGARPSLAGIKDSGWIEQDADMIILMHRDRGGTAEDSEPADTMTTELIVAKQRTGPVGSLMIKIVPKYCRFEPITAGSE